MATWITDNGSFNVGSAQDSSQTDNFTLAASGTTILGIGGNINVTGLPFPPATTPNDTNTTIYLWSVGGVISGVMDNFSLHGSMNSLSNLAFGSILTPIIGSTINDTVLGNGGFNSVNLTDTFSSTVKVAIGVDGSATAPAGHNNVLIQNFGGTNTVAVGGPTNTVNLIGSANTVFDGGSGGNVTLNGVTFGGGGATVHIGSPPVPGDDDLFGFSSTVTFAGTGNTLFGGDENFTVSGSTGSSAVHVGDGENTITMGGAGNIVSVWGGDNTINAGGGFSHVTILGLDGANTPTPIDSDAPPPDDGPVPLSPTDTVTISGAGDSVVATYENVNVLGMGVTSTAAIKLGDGNNVVILGGSGGNTVTVGNGSNIINATGSFSTYNLGDGANGVTLSGNSNTVNVTDPTGVGNDIVQLGAGTGDVVHLDHAAGSVTGTGLGLTTVTQAGPNAVTVNLHNGTGKITLGDGNDTVTANGGGTMIKAGNGNDIVTANGAGDTITLGNGKDIVIANGAGDIISLGNGNDTVTANGGGDKITLGNGANTVTANGAVDTLTLGNGNNSVTANGGADKFTFGNGNNTVTANGNGDVGTFGTPGLGGNNSLTATGAGDFWVFNEATTSTVTAALGTVSNGSDTLTQTNGSLNATLLGPSDTVNLSNVNTIGTTITSNGNKEAISFTNNSGGALVINPVSLLDSLTFKGALNKFAGTASVSGLNGSDSVTLNDLFTTGGAHILSFGQMLGAMSFTPTGDVLPLLGGGELKFAAGTPLVPTSFHYV